MNILGISCDYHDSAAAVVSDGVLVAAAQEERFTRKKNDPSFPQHAIAFCLAQAGITAKNLDYVAFYEKPFQKFHRILLSSLATYPKSLPFFVAAMRSFLLHKLWIKNKILEILDVPAKNVLFIPHHLSHAASAYFCSPFSDATIVTIDGVGEWATTTIGYGQDNTINIVAEQHFPHSLGLLYSTFTAFLGFEVNEGEYKVMGMAPFGKPRYKDKVYKLMKRYADGSFRLNLDYFSFHISEHASYSGKFLQLFGKPRRPGSHFSIQGDQYYADIAASLQAVTEELIFTIVQQARKKTPSNNLCLAGGVFLNSVANGKLFNHTPYNHVFIQPAAGDAGGALGAALYAARTKGKARKRFVLSHAFWGKEYSDRQILQALSGHNLSYHHVSNTSILLQHVVDALIQGKVIGWFQGRFEWGPRALGNRSILADPRNPNMKDIVNTKIKFREPFRPFAASILEGCERNICTLPETPGLPISFMLYVFPVNKSWQKRIPAVTHINGTTRPQVVAKRTNPLYWRLIRAFYKKTGVPLLLNTSFNLKGEPIVASPADAIKTFLKSGLDLLVMGHFIVTKLLDH